jgi:hypothetical protein
LPKRGEQLQAARSFSEITGKLYLSFDAYCRAVVVFSHFS